MIRRLPVALVLFVVAAATIPHRAAAQYPPYPQGYPPSPPSGEAPTGVERRERFLSHGYVIADYLPLNSWQYDSGAGPVSDLGMGGTLTAGYMADFGLGIEAKAGARHHATYGITNAGQKLSYNETEVPIAAGVRYDLASLWGGGYVEPFVATHLGAGGYFYADDVNNTDSEWDFLFDLGLGLDFYVTDYIALGLGYWFEYYAISDEITMHSLALQLTL